MSTLFSGSARLVCTPHDYSDPRAVFISSDLASKVMFCYAEADDNGIPASMCEERCLKEVDHDIL